MPFEAASCRAGGMEGGTEVGRPSPRRECGSRIGGAGLATFSMEVLIKPAVARVGNGVISIGKRYDINRIVTFATDGNDIYMVYRVRDVEELVDLSDRIAAMPQRLTPAEVAVELPLNIFEIFAGAEPRVAKFPARPIPEKLVTLDNLREVLIEHAEPWMLELTMVMRIVASYSTDKILLCDEVAETENLAYICRIEGRHFVKPGGSVWYEVPQEMWRRIAGRISVKERRACSGAGEARAALGPEVDEEELLKFAAERLGVAGQFLGRVLEILHYAGDEEHFCAVRRVRAYAVRPLGADYVFGKIDVLCVRQCYAWKAGEVDAEMPSEVIADCVENEACRPEFVDALPEPRRSELYGMLEGRLRWYFKNEWGPGVLRKFPLEVIRRVLGPVNSREEAEAKWRAVLEERELKREREAEEAARRLEEKKRRVAEEVAKLLEGLPVKVSVGKYVYVRPTRQLTEEERQRIDSLLQGYGFRYKERWKSWAFKPL